MGVFVYSVMYPAALCVKTLHAHRTNGIASPCKRIALKLDYLRAHNPPPSRDTPTTPRKAGGVQRSLVDGEAVFVCWEQTQARDMMPAAYLLCPPSSSLHVSVLF